MTSETLLKHQEELKKELEQSASNHNAMVGRFTEIQCLIDLLKEEADDASKTELQSRVDELTKAIDQSMAVYNALNGRYQECCEFIAKASAVTEVHPSVEEAVLIENNN